MVVPFTETGKYKEAPAVVGMSLVLNIMNLRHLSVNLVEDL